ncbi:Mobile element protein [hydrothermal vent metagenome]|uniref:Mobile element protein n=1 Tax=hydrothermal vent metagenome TaxID=652676 RepID=A0A3B0ZBC3_9ZZZZ
MTESLPIMLKSLRLPAFGQHYQDYQELATRKSWSYDRYLSQLCEQEVARRYQTRIHNWTKEAKLPQGKSFATLSINELPQVIQKKVIGLRDNTEWALQADNVLLIGPSGVGKSHIAAALGLQLIEQGVRVKWFQATALLQLLQQARQELDLMGVMSKLDKYRVLIIDDIGYVKKTDSETQVLFEFIAHRYESGSLIITSNQPFSHWDQIFPDTLMTVAAIDRIIHHATIVEIDGESYRRKHQQKS